jgi:hypothetical protein
MKLFGLACEGITDQITIENILCGYFKSKNLDDDEIKYVEPAFDESSQRQAKEFVELLNKYKKAELF